MTITETAEVLKAKYRQDKTRLFRAYRNQHLMATIYKSCYELSQQKKADELNKSLFGMVIVSGSTIGLLLPKPEDYNNNPKAWFGAVTDKYKGWEEYDRINIQILKKELRDTINMIADVDELKFTTKAYKIVITDYCKLIGIYSPEVNKTDTGFTVESDLLLPDNFNKIKNESGRDMISMTFDAWEKLLKTYYGKMTKYVFTDYPKSPAKMAEIK